jgi:GT2 family glycosyltransferase
MVGIITVITNEKHNLENFFYSLLRQTYKNYILYIVDNNSSDGSAEFFREIAENSDIDVKYIRLNYNSGFSGGSNIGAQSAINDGCRYLFNINNDVVMENHCLEELVKLIETGSETACTGPLLFRHRIKDPGIIQEFGGKVNFKTGKTNKYFANQNISDILLPETLEVDFIGGGVLMIKTDVFKSVGMWEEAYFAYYDEIDLYYRIKVLNKYKLYVTSRAVAYHNHNWTKKAKSKYYFEYYLSERNKFVYFRKYKLYSSIYKTVVIDLLKFPWRLRWFIKVCNFKLGLYYLKGAFDGLTNKKGKPKFIK